MKKLFLKITPILDKVNFFSLLMQIVTYFILYSDVNTIDVIYPKMRFEKNTFLQISSLKKVNFKKLQLMAC